jgi:2,4-dienoyl-CoA reductase-like NADH-dependent reductase (Old Yellow Enzyme family)
MNSVTDSGEERSAKTFATTLVPVGCVLEIELRSRMETVLASGHADAVRASRILLPRERVGRDRNRRH